MNTIDDMLNEKYFYGYYNEIEYNHDYEKLTMYMCESIFIVWSQ